MSGTLERLRGMAAHVFVRAVSGGGFPPRAGAAKTPTWLADKLCLSYHAAAAMVRLAELLDGPARETGAALAAGQITVDQAEVVADAVRRLPDPARPAG